MRGKLGRLARGLLGDPASRDLDRFFARFYGRSVIVHAGFAPEWLEELLKQPGGGGHFRLDVRHGPETRPTPIERVAHEHILPLGLPLPLILKVDTSSLLVRHLTRGGVPVHPTEILDIIGEIDDRHHARLMRRGRGFEVAWGLPVRENEVDWMSRLEGPG